MEPYLIWVDQHLELNNFLSFGLKVCTRQDDDVIAVTSSFWTGWSDGKDRLARENDSAKSQPHLHQWRHGGWKTFSPINLTSDTYENMLQVTIAVWCQKTLWVLEARVLWCGKWGHERQVFLEVQALGQHSRLLGSPLGYRELEKAWPWVLERSQAVMIVWWQHG